MKAEIIAVGTELLLGQIVDTNSAYIAQQLATIGLDLHFKSTVGDNLERIKNTLKLALSRADYIITTGGLGPTQDDLTREAVAEVLDKPLVFQPHLYQQISDFFQRAGRPMSPNNKKQAYIPAGSMPIENPVGTAPGFIAEKNGQAIIVLPGVPHEMRYFMEHSVLPYLRKKLGIKEVIVSRVIKLFGIGESMVDESIKDLMAAGVNPTIGLLAHTQIGEIHIRLTAKATAEAQAQNLIAPVEGEIKGRLGDYIFGVDEEKYEDVLIRLLEEKKVTLAIAETSFGSSAIQSLKMVDGHQDFFRLGLTFLDWEMAKKILPPAEEVAKGPEPDRVKRAKFLAAGVRQLAATDLGLSIVGQIAKQKEEDHVAAIALAHGAGTECIEQRWPFAMRYIENRMTKMALEQVRQYLRRI
ncbi:MAG: CinA family nicotinamide mononucleotide deamidase-related protein [Thermodesulfobacteriota bacterium]